VSGDSQGDRSEHVDDQHVGGPGGVDGVEAGVGEQLEEPLVQGERVGPSIGPPIISGTTPGCA